MNEQTQQALTELTPLTEAERLDARDKAREMVIRAYGDKPTPAQFEERQFSDYPRWFGRLAVVMMLTVFFAAGLVSFFRVFSAGRDHFIESIDVGYQAVLVGLATFILAEFLVITATLLGTIYVKGAWQRVLNTTAIVAGLLVAFVGNWHVTQPNDLWSLLETFTPPFAVLVTAVLGERMLLITLKRRQQSKVAYEQALADWKANTADPEQSDRWRMSYANALREMIRGANSHGAGKTKRVELMQGLDRAGWKALVWREIKADDWFDEAESDMVSVVEGAPIPLVISGHFGTIPPDQAANANGAMTPNVNGNGNAAGYANNEQK